MEEISHFINWFSARAKKYWFGIYAIKKLDKVTRRMIRNDFVKVKSLSFKKSKHGDEEVVFFDNKAETTKRIFDDMLKTIKFLAEHKTKFKYDDFNFYMAKEEPEALPTITTYKNYVGMIGPRIE